MKNNILLFNLIIVLFLSTSVSAQESKKITLQQAIDLSIANNHNLRISDLKITEAIANVRAAKDHRLPEASLSGSYLRLNSATVNLASAPEGQGGPDINQAVYGMINASYPIYTGGKLKYGIESANYLEQAARLNAANDKDGVIYNTIEAYTNLYKAGIAVSVIKENLIASSKRDTTFSRLEQNGLLARNDLLKAQLQTSNISLALLDAESNLKLANVSMDLIMGLPENTMIEVDPAFLDESQQLSTIDELTNKGLNLRKDVQVLEFQQKAAATSIKIAKADAYPSVALTGGYVAADIPGFITIANAVNVGVGVKYNIASLWKTNTGQDKAEAMLLELQSSKQLLSDQIKLQVNRDYQSYLLSKQKINVYETAILQATENYRITNNKYNNSLVTITDLLEADVSLLQAKLNVSLAKADAALAYQKILKTTGSLSK